MISFFRKLGWLGGAEQGGTSSRELQFHLERKPKSVSRRPVAGEARRAARRESRATSTWSRKTLAPPGAGPGRTVRPGPAYGLRTMASNRLSPRWRPIARAGNRRQHGDLQFHGRHPAALAAGGSIRSDW